MSREEGDEPLVGKPNLQGVENTGAIPRTYHRSRLQPGSTLFNSCSPSVPSLPFPKRKEAEKRAVRPFPPILAYFHLFSLSPSPSPCALCRDIASQTRKWPAGSSPPFWKMHAPVFVRIVRTHRRSHIHTSPVSTLGWGKYFRRPWKCMISGWWGREARRESITACTMARLLVIGGLVTRAPLVSDGNFLAEEVGVPMYRDESE